MWRTEQPDSGNEEEREQEGRKAREHHLVSSVSLARLRSVSLARLRSVSLVRLFVEKAESVFIGTRRVTA